MRTLATRIVKDIIVDLSDRSGLGSEWDMIDDEYKEEIKETWIKLVMNNLKEDSQ